MLAVVDAILADLTLPDGMFVGRRAEDGDAYSVVIQAGEDGRHRVPLDFDSLETFMAAAQAHLSEVYGRPVPPCPLHGHALAGRLRDGAPAWVCPEGEWSCQVGDYEDRTWPPDVRAGDLAAVFCRRLGRRGIKGWHTLQFTGRDGRWIAEVEIWPPDSALVDALARAAAPLPVAVEALAPPPIRCIVWSVRS
jgi:hypothetical protein